MKKLCTCLVVLVLLLGACAAPKAPSNADLQSSTAIMDSREDSTRRPEATSAAGEAGVDDNGGAPSYSTEQATSDSRLTPKDEGAFEDYLAIDQNQEVDTQQESMLTFSLKVDTAAYANVARFLNNGESPPADAVRTEELLNYFPYEGAMPTADGPFSVYTEVAPSPFHKGKYLAFTRVRAKDVDVSERPRSNLVFLIDTSGSMDSYDKLPLLKEAFSLLTRTLSEGDRVSIVTYAGSSQVVLSGEAGDRQETILYAIHNLSAGGSTAGADGIHTAYKLAEENFIEGGNNRVLLATDGDFNVGISSASALATFISGKRDTGVYLSILGFGTGNLRDDVCETLSKHGNGNYSYIDSVSTAEKVLVDELAKNLFTIADDVKAQVEFNPENVSSYRLIGYENRRMANRDFRDDKKDAGEIGIGTDVIVLFEIELRDGGTGGGYRYGTKEAVPQPSGTGEFANELFDVRIRYKDPGQTTAREIHRPVQYQDIVEATSDDFRFAASVAELGDRLRGSVGTSLADITALAKGAQGEDSKGYRLEHLVLLKNAQRVLGE